MSKHTPYKIGLGQAFLNRSIVIFLTLLFLLCASTAGAAYAEYKSGYIRKTVGEPVKNFLTSVGEAFEEKEAPPLTKIEINSTSSATIKINGKLNTPTSAPAAQKKYVAPVKTAAPTAVPTSTGPSLEEIAAQNKALSDQLSAQSKADLEKFKQESQQKFEQFKLEGQQGLEEFRQKYGN